jgi:hypothetical protein
LGGHGVADVLFERVTGAGRQLGVHAPDFQP